MEIRGLSDRSHSPSVDFSLRAVSQTERVSQNFPTNNSYRQSAKMCNFIKDWGTDRRSIGGMGEGGMPRQLVANQENHPIL